MFLTFIRSFYKHICIDVVAISIGAYYIFIIIIIIVTDFATFWFLVDYNRKCCIV